MQPWPRCAAWPLPVVASEAAELQHILSAQAIAELLTPADLAGTFLFLGSSLAAAVTGQALVVSRGEMMH